MTRSQQELLNLLKKVAAFLDENGITFYLFGGTAIGALRHRGFIPWDDDIDILVDRDNYYKLMEASKNLPDDLEYHCYEINHDYAKPYGMFSTKLNTCTSRSRIYWGGVCMGSPIDVFLTDEVPEDKVEEYRKDLYLYQEVMVDAWLYKDDITNYKDEYFALKKRQKEIGKPALIAELKAKLEQYTYEESDKRVVRVSGRSRLRDYPKEWIGEPRYCMFEGLKMPVQTRPEACLRLQYGYDWYLIPEPENRDSHVQISNFDISYNNYYKDISNFMDWDKVPATLQKRKASKIRRIDSQRAVRSFEDELMSNAVLMREDPESKACRIREMYLAKDYMGVLKEMSGLMDEIKLFVRSGFGKGGIDSDTLRIWIESLIRAGRYFDAVKVRKAFVAEDKMTDELSKTLELLDAVIKVAECWQDGIEDECIAALKQVPEEYRKEVADCIVAEAWLKEAGKLSIESKDLITTCDKYLSLFSVNYDVMRAKADELIMSGQITEGEELYQKVKDNSRNGLDLLRIEDYFTTKNGTVTEG